MSSDAETNWELQPDISGSMTEVPCGEKSEKICPKYETRRNLNWRKVKKVLDPVHWRLKFGLKKLNHGYLFIIYIQAIDINKYLQSVR